MSPDESTLVVLYLQRGSTHQIVSAKLKTGDHLSHEKYNTVMPPRTHISDTMTRGSE